MKEMFNRLRTRFDALNRRERIFVTLAVWLVALFLLDAMAITPARQRHATATKASADKQGEIARFEAELAGLRSRQAEDPDALAKRRIAELESKIAAIDSHLKAALGRTVPPERMAELLDQLLRKNKKLELASLRSLAPEVLVRNESAADAGKSEGGREKAEGGLLYRQGMELTLSGGYLDMLEYLAEVERLPWKIYWGRLELKVEEYPRAKLVLSVYTLSLDREWLSI